ncbi:phosphoenolpyruvate--protein phosphotransferase [bacterium]|nr:phosphoenolpyruvate--protein phosphotransferase [bacterium]
MAVIKGIAASPGYAVGKLFCIEKKRPEPVANPILKKNIEPEQKRFKDAVAVAAQQIRDLAAKLKAELGKDEAAIIESQLLILEDELILDSTLCRIEEELQNAEYLFTKSIAEVVSRFHDLQDSYYKERILDLRDVEERVLRILMGLDHNEVVGPSEDCIVCANELTPSDTAAIGTTNVLGFLLEEGSRTSHVAILSRSMGVPAVVGLGEALTGLSDGDSVAIDGHLGELIVTPDKEIIRKFKLLYHKESALNEKLAHLKDVPAETPDGHRIKMFNNIELPIEVDKALLCGSEGIGLLRTEYIYFQHGSIPSEDEQMEVYSEIVKKMDGRPVVFRTLDVGGDKVQRYLGARKEFNPFLGWRGIRFLLANPALLKSQLRAMFRAAAGGPSKIMFPMITGVDELRKARQICRECCNELAAESIEHDPDVEIGIMVETPSAVAIADLLAAECDFFSIGTNDLIQYSLSMDRLNRRVSYLYQPLHPAVLRFMKSAIDAAHNAGIKVSICGEMASETRFAEVLLGLGFDEISTHAVQLPKVKQVIRWTTMSEAKQLLSDLMSFSTAAEAEAHLDEYLIAKKSVRKNN